MLFRPRPCALLLALALGGCPLARAQAVPDRCPLVIALAADGKLYEDSSGKFVRRSWAVLEEHLQAGCYPEGGPNPVSSVTIEAANGASFGSVQKLYALVAKNGWLKEKVKFTTWDGRLRSSPHTASRQPQ